MIVQQATSPAENDIPKLKAGQPARRRAVESSEGGRPGLPIPSEEKRFRVMLLSRETGIDTEQARVLVDRIEMDGAALFDAAWQTKRLD
ncbi:hypothetical protein FJ950_28205 [Mesorhizobium sp. B2-3-14]|uniref:hypothetical protein n=1 Tax=unclassified Mesorhizobium TaxID=325217 RepID=UPI00112B0762|nr:MULTISPECIES: hypothetical protein [unclassified Mesorhizobium]TPK73887.1 hypothetical protein FJ527_22320 [Mesorhizobium sp. B2-4-18]TPL79293.1 hypothetical protein FJ950_28205 [Mesorhizobium sp. B2-3-14]TPL99738.1 hypothetical protein FJ943_15055 [Mesorhizobium sp. B2-3-10]